MRFSLTIAALAALGLAACDAKPAADGAATTGDPVASTPAAPETPAASAALAAEMEGPAAGKWRSTMSTSGMTMPPMEVCYGKAMTMEEARATQAQAGTTCSESSYRRDGDAILAHHVCTTGSMKITTDMRVTGDFKTKYTMEMTNVMDPPPAPGMAEQKITIVSERIGDC